MNVLTAVEDLRALFNNPTNWTQGTMARNMSGHAVDPKSEIATCWCLSGGIIKLGISRHTKALRFIRSFVLQRSEMNYMSHFNDQSTYAEFIQMLDELKEHAIIHEKSQEAESSVIS